MSLTIELPVTTQATLAERARAMGLPVEEYASQVLRDATVDRRSTDVRPAESRTHAERLDAFERLVAEAESDPLPAVVVDDSRQTLYGGPDGRGE